MCSRVAAGVPGVPFITCPVVQGRDHMSLQSSLVHGVPSTLSVPEMQQVSL